MLFRSEPGRGVAVDTGKDVGGSAGGSPTPEQAKETSNIMMVIDRNLCLKIIYRSKTNRTKVPFWVAGIVTE